MLGGFRFSSIGTQTSLRQQSVGERPVSVCPRRTVKSLSYRVVLLKEASIANDRLLFIHDHSTNRKNCEGGTIEP